MKRRWIQLGIVGKAHGLNGAFFISQRDEGLPPQVKKIRIGLDPEQAKILTIVQSRMQSERPWVLCAEVESREMAATLLMQPLWCEREILTIDEGQEYLWADVLGKAVLDSAGHLVGKVMDIGNFGASDIVRIVNEKGQELEIPFVSAYFDMNFKGTDLQLHLLVSHTIFEESWSPA